MKNIRSYFIVAARCISVTFLVTNCAPSKALIDSPEVGEYDQYIASKAPTEIFELLVARANEPYVLGGEDVSGLTLTTLSIFKKLGDRDSERLLLSASEKQRSAVKLFINGNYFGSDFPKTRKIIDSIPYDREWPSVKAEHAN